jgi:hypothetical protein
MADIERRLANGSLLPAAAQRLRAQLLDKMLQANAAKTEAVRAQGGPPPEVVSGRMKLVQMPSGKPPSDPTACWVEYRPLAGRLRWGLSEAALSSKLDGGKHGRVTELDIGRYVFMFYIIV